MEIRCVEQGEAGRLAEIESACFPAAEAATARELRERLACYGGHFYAAWEGERMVGFIDGMVTDEADLRDEMYARADLHREDGAWQMIFGVNTLPEERRRGVAAALIRRMIDEARRQGRRGLVLTCKERLIPYYASFGFRDEGVSDSTHGDAVWHQMRLTF